MEEIIVVEKLNKSYQHKNRFGITVYCSVYDRRNNSNVRNFYSIGSGVSVGARSTIYRFVHSGFGRYRTMYVYHVLHWTHFSEGWVFQKVRTNNDCYICYYLLLRSKCDCNHELFLHSCLPPVHCSCIFGTYILQRR